MPSKYVPKPAQAAEKPTPSGDTSNTHPHIATLTRLLGGFGSGTVGAIPTPFNSAAAAAIGGGAEAAAEWLEQPTGTPLSKSRIGTEAALSAIPLSKVYTGGKMLGNMLRGAGLAEMGNLGRRKAATGDYLPHDSHEVLSDLASVALGGAVGVPTAMAASHGVAPAPTALENLVHEVTSKPPTGGTSDVGTGGLQVSSQTPRVRKPGGVMVWDDMGKGIDPEVPKDTAAKTAALKAGVQREKPVADVDKNIADTRKISSTQRGLNEETDKAFLKRKVTVAKAETQAAGMKAKEAAVTKKLEDQFANADSKRNVKFADEQTKAANLASEEAAAQLKIDTAMNNPNMKPSPPVVTDSATLKVPGGSQTLKQTFRETPPTEKGDAGGTFKDLPADAGESVVNPGAYTPEHAAQTAFSNKQFAKDVALKTGAIDVRKVAPRKYKLIYKDAVAEGIPGEPFSPPTTPTEAPPSLERDAIAAKTYKNKVEAAAIAKATGGKVNQVGPRNYKVQFTPEETPTLTPSTSTPNPLENVKFNDEPALKTTGKPLDEPAKSQDAMVHGYGKEWYASKGTQQLGPFPSIKEATIASKTLDAPPVADVSDYTGGQPVHTVDVPIPGTGKGAKFADVSAGSKSLETLLDSIHGEERPSTGNGTFKESEPSIPGLESVAKTENPTPKLAEPTFSLERPVAKGVKPVEPSLLDAKREELAQTVKASREKLDTIVADMKAKNAVEAADPNNKWNKMLNPEQPQEPSVPQGGAIPARLYKTPLEAAGEGYGAIKAAKLAGEKVPEAGRAAAGKAAQRLGKEVPLSKGEAEPNSSELSNMTPEAQSKALTDLVNKFKSQKGEANVALLSRLGLGAAGAAVGAASDKDDPLTGALLGGVAGAYAPSVVRALISHASGGNLPESSLKAIAEKAQDVATTAFKMMPDLQRFNLLSNPANLMMNMWVGPWGSAIMAGIEHSIMGDPRGVRVLKSLLNPKNFPKEWGASVEEAKTLIAQSESRAEGTGKLVGPAAFRKWTGYPGVGMTAGDLAARNILMEAGFSTEEARRITLTSEPYSPLGNAISKFKKGAMTEGGKKSWLVDMMLPFYRTSVNQIEQGIERTPGFGFLFQKYAKDIPDPMKAQFVQQFVGGGVGTMSYILGNVVPPDQAKIVVKFINNFGGQYGKVASTAFMMGQASQTGKSPAGALSQTLVRDMPLPSTDILSNMGTNYRALTEGDRDFKPPFQVIPGVLDPDVPLSIPSLAGMAIGGYNDATTPPSTKPRGSRYVPPARKAQ